MTAREAVRAVLGERWGGAVDEGAAGEAYAPANIALVKYWGKRDEELKLPVAGSLSVSLGDLGTRTRVRRLGAGAGEDEVTLNGRRVGGGEGFARRVGTYLDLFRAEGERYAVETENTVPTAAGLASSASGFAALAMALDKLYGWGCTARELSVLARLGSGSAARSVEEGFVEWRKGEREDGADSWAERLDAEWPGFRVGALVVSGAAKGVGSGEGMRRTAATSDFYALWPARVERDLAAMKEAIAARDMARVGEIAEGNALAMHATMATARPPLVYALPETVAAMREVWAARAEGVGVWLTMDAGPNVKLLFGAGDEADVRRRWPGVRVVAPFG
jgi:diphosphomevalonate decarboxylase